MIFIAKAQKYCSYYFKKAQRKTLSEFKILKGFVYNFNLTKFPSTNQKILSAKPNRFEDVKPSDFR